VDELYAGFWFVSCISVIFYIVGNSMPAFCISAAAAAAAAADAASATASDARGCGEGVRSSATLGSRARRFMSVEIRRH